jgi:peroxiredoxin
MAKKKVGAKVVGFALRDQDGEGVRLAALRGKRVILSFHPLAWTSVCAKQMQSLEANKKQFDALNTVAMGVSVDSVPSKAAWAKSLRIKQTRLLADFWPHGAVARQFALFREKDGFSQRANVIIDERGRIIFRKIYPLRKLPEIKEIMRFLETT